MSILDAKMWLSGLVDVNPSLLSISTNDTLSKILGNASYLNAAIKERLLNLSPNNGYLALVETSDSGTVLLNVNAVASGADFNYGLTYPASQNIQILGTTNQIVSTTTDGNVVLSLSPNAVLPGTGGVTLPSGTTAQRAGGAGSIRLNTTTNAFEGTLDSTNWSSFGVPVSNVSSVGGTIGQISVSTPTGSPVISIDPTYIGQTSITTLGTVTTGSWTASAIPVTSGGTGLTTIAANKLLYSSALNTIAGLATANNGVLITSGAGVPSIGTTLPAAVQGNITSTGIITSGTWASSTPVGAAYGGTGVANTNTITLGGNITTAGAFTTAGAYAATLTFTAPTNVTFPANGTLATTSQLPVLPLSLANGGTGAALVASNGGIFYSTATAGAILAGTAIANQMLLSGANAAPAWSTATYPATTTVNQILYSSAANQITGLATASSATLVTTSAGVPVMTAPMTNGQIVIGSTSGTPTPATLTAGANIEITNAAGSITIAGEGAGAIWVTAQTSNFTANDGYGYPVNTAGGAITVTLPPLPLSIGNFVTLVDYNGNWGTNYLTINPNGSKINGLTSNYICSVANAALSLVYVDTVEGWLVYDNFNNPNTYVVNYLVVGGGGGGGGFSSGNSCGGGGGAGGVLTGTAIVTQGVAYTVTVGTGGAGGTTANRGTQGLNSSITGGVINVVAYGGGGGGSYSQPPSNGGGGGGGQGYNGSNAAYQIGYGTPGQGFWGEAGSATGTSAGGGGGSGASGANPGSTTAGGAGGAAKSLTILGAAAYYAGGGGGGASSTGGTGANSVGGNGGTSAAVPTAGAANTGSGGGGSGGYTPYAGAAGGSGTIIIYYTGIQRGIGGNTVSTVANVTGHYFTSTGNSTFTA
jgi:hypothetical protein